MATHWPCGLGCLTVLSLKRHVSSLDQVSISQRQSFAQVDNDSRSCLNPYHILASHLVVCCTTLTLVVTPLGLITD